MAHLLRCLFFLEAKHELSLTVVHVRGVDNGAADEMNRMCFFVCVRRRVTGKPQ